ncbi:DUF2806 domain-containing protein [Rhizobium sp. CC1099]|uniref:DUF2806 domain-containing protein n=1 Tax=Rhizobium sp. CC1099 TaxID=3039160 RepID=UPI0024B1DF38|nr:DUF2806 domain-containing protein [Rhizobium sp. CC1099]WFU89481.1 DUF2806 domain-containing protein [Rhizobium sp. CC1099]
MPEDHLSSETSLSVEITSTGIKASAKSRAIAAVERLLGNVADLGNAWIEGATTRKRAKNEGERQLIEAAAKYGVERMGYDEELAKRAFENHFKKVAQAQVNKDAVAHAAIQDLRRHNPTDEETNSGPDEVSEEFMARFEGYAEGATTEQLRERWGRILAGEIRKPGTFSPKVMRTTDELDAATAELFEELVPFRLVDCIVKCIMPRELDFEQSLRLVSAGLLVEPGLAGHQRLFASGQSNTGQKKVWIHTFGKFAVGFAQDTKADFDQKILVDNDGKPSTPVYVLTDVGRALSSILPSNEENAGFEYAKKLASVLPQGSVMTWLVLPDGSLRPSPIKF